MTWKGIRPMIQLIRRIYEKGIRPLEEEIESDKKRLERSKALPKWDVTINPVW